MEAEFAAAERLLADILSKRGETIPEKLLGKLVKWGRDRGFFGSPATLFSSDKWQDIGNKMRELTIEEQDKTCEELQVPWQTVINVLKNMKAESCAAASAAAFAPELEAASEPEVTPTPALVHKGPYADSIFPWDPREEKTLQPPLVPPDDPRHACDAAPAPTAPPAAGRKESHESYSCNAESSDGDCEKLARTLSDRTEGLPLLQPAERLHHLFPCESETAAAEDTLTAAVSRPATCPVSDNTVIASDSPSTRLLNSDQESRVARDPILKSDSQALAACSSQTPFSLPARNSNSPERDSTLGTQYTSISWKLLKRLQAAVANYSLHSKAAREIINDLFDSNVFTPEDCVDITKIVLPPADFHLWKWFWEDECRKIINEPSTVRDPLYAVTLNKAATEAAKNALLKVLPEEKLLN